MNPRIWRCLFTAVVAGALSLPATAHSTDPAMGGRYDRAIAVEVNHRLQGDAKLRDVRATVDDGVVTLTGSVARYADKAKAEKKAGKVKNVADVRNRIAVRTENITDTQLAARLGRKLAYDPYSGYGRYSSGPLFNHLTVSVRNGMVILGGEVRNESARDYAQSVAENEKGVRGVENRIRVLPTSIFDDDIRARAARAIYGDPVLRRYAIDPGAPIRIVVEHGHITLYGVVANRLDSQVAEIRAREVPGAFSVENRLVVGKEIAY